ncbi:Receptor-interacting serine/threonine-protein kinase 4 (Ankyrin repeat domain-containing protein 3) (PKC-associated protein kinase) (PKC-regulated protein kinase) [Durusdinium trenchii]|uniref:Receptor-interacting serine/threonine-protein kinase 4 (Ankyrin repeat domain-containing protein 3) (PKC-associated protein kinase) (PKC-regulated protein kinase) n=1 Tax=Durusdinium trenchii TaxID=1381693 RepID=A0ABP0IZZ9_9DINO
MQQIRAWRKAPEATAVSVATHAFDETRGASLTSQRLTELFASKKALQPSEKLEDGFQDLGRSASTDSSPCCSAPLLVDRSEDGILVEFLEKVNKKLARTSDAVTRVMVTAFQVSETLGRSGSHASTVWTRCERLLREKSDAERGVLLGSLMHEIQEGKARKNSIGAGTSRVRSVLFKAVCDWLAVAPCSLQRQENMVTWNTVQVDGDHYVVDVIFEPGALYEEGSGKAGEYLRRLESEGEDVPRGAVRPGAAAIPSLQPNLGGLMLRPSWHVEPWEIDFDRRDRAGRGGFGEVFQGTWAGQPVAVKEVRDASPTDADVCDFVLEISLLSRLSHPNIVRFWRGCVDLRGGHRTLLLVTEWMDRGVLSQLLHESQEPSLSVASAQVLATGIARGVAYLHHVKILHLDLKSPNVLLNSTWQPKLCDFGLAKIREQTALQTTLRGVSPIWAPPEMFDDKGGVTEKADVYSFGIILFELGARKLPYSDVGQMQLPRVKAKGQLPRFPAEMDPDQTELIRLCLAPRPSNRPAISALILKIKDLCKSKGIDLEAEQVAMEQQGLHFTGVAGSTPHVEQLRRAEAEKRRAEQELARLRRLLAEEETHVRTMEAAAGGAAPVEQKERAFEEFCEQRTQAVGEQKFRCLVCRKLFRAPEFVHKHLRERHWDDFQSGRPVELVETGKLEEDFFDADVAEESSTQLYTQKFEQGGSFSQAVQDAAEKGDLACLQQVSQQNVALLKQSDVDGSTPLHLCAKQGHAQCVQLLLQNGVDATAADDGGHLPLHLAAQEGHHEAVAQLLLAPDVALDALSSGAKQRTALHLAAANGHAEVCGALLLQRADVNLQDADGESPLHKAARFGDLELCELIFSFGASVTSADQDGWHPLHEAARWGDGALVESFLRRGADLHARSNDGESALHVVPGGYADLEVVQVLLTWKSDVNGRDYDGETPLHLAVKLGDVELAGLLLQHNADANATNTQGATPLDFAKKDELRWLLRSHKGRKGTGAL